MEGEAVKGKNEKQRMRACAFAREKAFTVSGPSSSPTAACRRRAIPDAEKHRAGIRSPKARQTAVRCSLLPYIRHDSSSDTRQNVRGRHTMNLRVFMKCTLQNEDFSAKRLFAPRK